MAITPTLRAARTIVRAKTTPHTAAHVRWAAGALALFTVVALTMNLGQSLVLLGMVGLFYRAGQYAGLSQAWREEAPYTVEMEGDADLDELPEH